MTDNIYDLSLFRRDNPNTSQRYNPQQVITAITILMGDLKERNGIETPRYAHYSRLLNIPSQTLRQWYISKEDIFKTHESAAKGIILSVQLQLVASLPKIINKLNESLDNNDMKDSDKINYLNNAVNKLRLLSNQSTSNVEVNVNQFEPIPLKK